MSSVKGQHASVSAFGTKPGRRHFHTFDALRFFAFFKVFLLHLPVVAFPWFNFIRAGGGIGVQFFFVLSGFLITYIVCEEKQRTGNLNLKNFFLRRALRIWPLYYAMVAVAYATPFILQHYLHLSSSADGYKPDFLMSVLFLENYQMMITHDHANVSPLSVMWSLCIEEHFYIVWGLVLYFIQVSTLRMVIVVSIVLAPTARFIYVGYNIPTSDLITNIDLFAYGALPAYLWIEHEEKVAQRLNHISFRAKLLFVGVVLIVVLLCSQLKGDAAFILTTSLLGILFATVLLLTLPENNRLKIKDNNVLSRLGLYTYGLYLFHTLVINLLRQVFLMKNWDYNTTGGAIIFIIASIVLTLFFSILSYHFFEKPFLKLKKYFI